MGVITEDMNRKKGGSLKGGSTVCLCFDLVGFYLAMARLLRAHSFHKAEERCVFTNSSVC